MYSRSSVIPTSSYSGYPRVNSEFYSNPGRSYANGTSYASLQDDREMLSAHAVPATVPVPQYAGNTSGMRPADPWSDFQSMNQQQSEQMDLQSLMPQNWQSSASKTLQNPRDDWTRFTVTPEGFSRYVSASGASRIMAIGKNSLGRVVGTPNLLRNEPPTAFTLGPDAVIFNDSSARLSMANNQYRPFIGCGN